MLGSRDRPLNLISLCVVFRLCKLSENTSSRVFFCLRHVLLRNKKLIFHFCMGFPTEQMQGLWEESADSRNLVVRWDQDEKRKWDYSIDFTDFRTIIESVPFKNCKIVACITDDKFLYCLDVASIATEVPLTKPRFDVHLISEFLRTNRFMTIQIYRKDRTLASVTINTRSDVTPGQTTIWSRAENVDETLASGLLKTEETREAELDKFLKRTRKKLNSFKECSYCLKPHLSSLSSCNNCTAFASMTCSEECMVCKESNHPIGFRCKTCIDSNVCLECTSNKLWKKICPTCKQKQVVFGGKRPREEEYSDYESD